MSKVKFCFANVSCLKNHNLDHKANYSKLQVKALSLSYFMEYTNISSEIRVFFCILGQLSSASDVSSVRPRGCLCSTLRRLSGDVGRI